MAQTNKPTPANGKTNINNSQALCCFLISRGRTNTTGLDTRFQNSANSQAPTMTDRVEEAICPLAQSSRHSQGESGWSFLHCSRRLDSLAAARAMARPPKPTPPKTSENTTKSAAFFQS